MEGWKSWMDEIMPEKRAEAPYIGKHARKYPVQNTGYRYQTQVVLKGPVRHVGDGYRGQVIVRGYPPAQPIRSPQVETWEQKEPPTWRQLGQMLLKKIKGL